MISFHLHKQLNQGTNLLELNVQLELNKGEFIGLKGNSGAGKTSILRMLCGLLKPDEGFIQKDDTFWFQSKKGINTPPQKRNIGLLFQDYALFPNMTVIEQLRYALPSNRNKDQIAELIKTLEIGDILDRYPVHLSGGQKQRVALARALIPGPEILLLDEPFGSLDSELKHSIQSYILDIHSKFQMTTIMVSHDESVLRTMADRVYLLSLGEISEIDKSSFPDSLVVTGRIVCKEKKGDVWIVKIEKGGKLISVQLGEKKGNPLREGDSLEILCEVIAVN